MALCENLVDGQAVTISKIVQWVLLPAGLKLYAECHAPPYTNVHNPYRI